MIDVGEHRETTRPARDVVADEWGNRAASPQRTLRWRTTLHLCNDGERGARIGAQAISEPPCWLKIATFRDQIIGRTIVSSCDSAMLRDDRFEVHD